MLNSDQKYATCDWPHCQEDFILVNKTYNKQIEELKKAGWRASRLLGSYCICKHHNQSREWE